MYYWDALVGRYRDEKGRFVARDTVYSYVNQSLTISTNVTESLGGYVYNGTISVNDWMLAMQQEIKDEYIRQYMSFAGGRYAMTPADWGSIGGMVGEQYKYLKGFAQDIATGNLTEAQIIARSNMYINSAREARERARGRSASKAQFDEVYWELNAALENCGGCIEFNMMDWQLVEDDPYKGAFPGSGDTVCLTNCGCQLSYRNGKTGEEYDY
jgi:hypothetical protein